MFHFFFDYFGLRIFFLKGMSSPLNSRSSFIKTANQTGIKLLLVYSYFEKIKIYMNCILKIFKIKLKRKGICT